MPETNSYREHPLSAAILQEREAKEKRRLSIEVTREYDSRNLPCHTLIKISKTGEQC